MNEHDDFIPVVISVNVLVTFMILAFCVVLAL